MWECGAVYKSYNLGITFLELFSFFNHILHTGNAYM